MRPSPAICLPAWGIIAKMGKTLNARVTIQAALSIVPCCLIALRVLLGPVALILALHAMRWEIVCVLTLAFLSDVFDGVIARRLGVVTAGLRISDSVADAWYFLCLALAACLVHPAVVSAFRVPLLSVLMLQSGSYLLAWRRYGRIASFHAYTAKLWGLSLFIAFVALLGWGIGGWPLRAAIIMGFVSTLEGIAMILLLPRWTHDVAGLAEALRRRR